MLSVSKGIKRVLIAAGSVVLLLAAFVLMMVQPGGAAERVGPVVSVDAQRLRSDVTKLSTEFSPRDHQNVANLDLTAAWIRSELEPTGARLEEQTWQVDGKEYRNVLAHYGSVAGEKIIVGAHYDVCGPYPGADDNGSGVAALLAIARLLKEHPPRVPVELAFWSLEEPPFFRTQSMGSWVHAKSLRDAKAEVRFALSLETIGYFTDAPDSQKVPVGFLKYLYSSTGNYLALVGNTGQIALTRRMKAAMRAGSPLPIHSINAPVAIPGIDYSDHLNFWRVGYPALMLTDTAMNRNPNYHLASDTPDTLDYARLAQATQAVFEAICALQ